MNQVTALAVPYDVDGQAFEGRLVFNPSITTLRPGLLMAPNWMGISEGALEIARQVAERGYVVFIADVYGRDLRPQTAEEAGAAMMALKLESNRLRRRMQVALDVLRSPLDLALDTSKLAAFGFCFGGHCVLELARSGAPLLATVPFHGTLDTEEPADARNITGSVLVLNGASDPLVPDEQLAAFSAEMTAASVDWQLMNYGNAFHSFTDPQASVPGLMQYDPKVSQRAFSAMYALFDEVFQR